MLRFSRKQKEALYITCYNRGLSVNNFIVVIEFKGIVNCFTKTVKQP